MKNSTLLRLFFISIGLPLTCASPSTSSIAVTLKPKRKPASLSVDTTNNVEPVQPKGHGIVVRDFSWKYPFLQTKWQGPEDFQELLGAGKYGTIIKIGKSMKDDEFLMHLCPVITTLDHFKGLLEYLKQHKMVAGFLAHGEMVLVRKVVAETGLFETEYDGECGSIYDAIALSFKEDRHERVAGLFEAAKGRPNWRDNFDWFVNGFFDRHAPEKDDVPLKRFFTLHGEEFNRKHPAIFKTICQGLVGKLRLQLDNADSQKLLIGLIGQPSLLTPAAFARGFLYLAGGGDRANFIKCGYRETIEEGLKKKYQYGGRYLWDLMVSTLPNQFFGKYPSTDEARSIALKNFKPTKQDLEEQWLLNNAQNPRTMLRMGQLAKSLDELDITFPTVLCVIVAEYATVPTLLDIE